MNGRDDKFSYGLSIGNDSISKWIIPENLVPENTTVLQETTTDDKLPLSEVASSELPIVNTPTADIVSESTDKESKIIDIAANSEEQAQAINTSAESSEKRKREEEQVDDVIANTFKKAKTANNTCENGKLLLVERDNRHN